VLDNYITELEKYVNHNEIDMNLEVVDFLTDIKDLQPELNVYAIMYKMINRYKDGEPVTEIIERTKKSKRIFTLAGGFLNNTCSDNMILNIVGEIHKIIDINFDTAIDCFKCEFDC